jgi:GNAT superfamily N-acetyltransferase
MKLQQILFLALCAINQVMPSAPAGMATTAAAASALTPIAPASIQIPHLTEFDPRVQAFLRDKYNKHFKNLMDAIIVDRPEYNKETDTVIPHNEEYSDTIEQFQRIMANDNPARVLQQTEACMRELLCACIGIQPSTIEMATKVLIDENTHPNHPVVVELKSLGIQKYKLLITQEQGLNAEVWLGSLIKISPEMLDKRVIESDMLAGVCAHEAQHIKYRDTIINFLYRDLAPYLRRPQEMRADVMGALEGSRYFNGLVKFLEATHHTMPCVDSLHGSHKNRLAVLHQIATELMTPYETLIKEPQADPQTPTYTKEYVSNYTSRYIVSINYRIIGIIQWTIVPGDMTAKIDLLYVQPQHRKKKYGTYLLQHACATIGTKISRAEIDIVPFEYQDNTIPLSTESNKIKKTTWDEQDMLIRFFSKHDFHLYKSTPLRTVLQRTFPQTAS